MLRSLDNSLGNGVYLMTNKAVGESNPVNTADQQGHMIKARTAQRMEKMYEMSKVQSLQFCVQVQGAAQ